MIFLRLMHTFPIRDRIMLTKLGNIYNMRIISRKTLRDFVDRFPDSEDQLSVWWAEAKAAKWMNHADVKAQYRNASLLKKSRVVFNICGNKYRLIVKFEYEIQLGYIRFVGTHKEYDNINAEEV